MEIKTHTQLNSLQEFEFEKTPVMAGNTHTGEMIAIRPCVENLGLNWSGQLQALRRNPILDELCVSVKAIAGDGKSREMVCLPPSVFQEWLWSLAPNSENFNIALWENYKKGLVVYLLMMLKMSLDELQKSQAMTDSFKELRKLNEEKKAAERRLSEVQSDAGKIKADIQRIQREIDEILSSNPNQLKLPLA
jgi:hypothetical protein